MIHPFSCRAVRSAFISGLIIIFLSVNLFAQSQATTGNIVGRVLDPQSAVVPGATVLATNQATGFEKSVVAEGDGNFRLILLPPGTYTVKTSSSGFAETTLTDVAVTVGGTVSLDISLGVQGTNETVTVASTSASIETTRTSVSTTVN
ncbi:MAG: carboxypeptidase-like regulatory domain-containing protein, partial [Pyrinomonadaceae bacterium]